MVSLYVGKKSDPIELRLDYWLLGAGLGVAGDRENVHQKEVPFT